MSQRKPNVVIFGLALCISIIACNSNKEDNASIVESLEPLVTETFNPVERGEYLVSTNGCHDCHSPKIFTEEGVKVDPDRELSGHPSNEKLPPYDEETARGYVLFSAGLTSATGPWGTSFAANLTPDETGLGNWTEEQFLTCIKKGLLKGMEGSRPLLPPMPWEHYKNFTDEDLKSIFAYLQSRKPVSNIVPDPIPPKGK
ncbi:diheme cytochrome c-553 [Mangrovivirga sp. M17]|uniref:Diheme cytochrome c-553 n=1 Tax=Mangrovivirga halotolerans TaxID=2993936 RepID=A0ABT3RUR9_9BACT|nr:c-type cytochrome [Mangrovivirga halotolerans]MCX2745526.1 diheme cytochrome c-553 [Mangrovivirga halotolerans]